MKQTLIGVLSAATYDERRAACNETWIAAARARGFEVLYILGDPRLKSPERRGDLLVCPCNEDYNSLSEKTRWLCRWAVEETGAEQVFKCDDDTFVHVARFAAFEPSAAYGGHDLGGYCSGGAGYWLSRDAAQIVADTLTESIWCEDCAVGKVVAAAGLPLQACARFHPWNNRWPESTNDLITTHYCPPERMRELFALTKDIA